MDAEVLAAGFVNAERAALHSGASTTTCARSLWSTMYSSAKSRAPGARRKVERRNVVPARPSGFRSKAAAGKDGAHCALCASIVTG